MDKEEIACKKHGIKGCTFCDPEKDIKNFEFNMFYISKTADDIIKEVSEQVKNLFNNKSKPNQ